MTDSPPPAGSGPPEMVWTGSQEAAGRTALPSFLAGTPVAVLAGFNLATAILVVSQRPSADKLGLWASYSSTFLLIGAAAFLITMALSGRAQFLALDPGQAATWWPEMALDEAELNEVRNRVWRSQARVSALIAKATFSWIAGLFLTSLGVGVGVLSYKIDAGHVIAALSMLVGSLVVAVVFAWPVNLGVGEKAAPPLSVRARQLLLAPPERGGPDPKTVTEIAAVAETPTEEGHEWGWRDVVWMTALLIVGFGLVSATALAVPGFTGSAVILSLITGLLVLGNMGLGVLLVGLYIEVKHTDWSRFGGWDHVVQVLVTVGLLFTDAMILWWSSGSALIPTWLLIVAAVSIVVGGLLSRLLLWPHNRPAMPGSWFDSFSFLTMLVGLAAGAVLSVLLLVGSAWYHTDFTSTAGPLVPPVSGISGSYVAIGDSYSAGEGLEPWVGSSVFGRPSPFGSDCHRSASAAYPELLKDQNGKPLLERDGSMFNACSGAIIADVLKARPDSSVTAPQVASGVYRKVGLVTLTIGGNDVLFSRVVFDCVKSPDCLTADFPESGDPAGWFPDVKKGPLAKSWAPQTILDIARADGTLFGALRNKFPKARIVVVGYPYLFSAGPAFSDGIPRLPLDCLSILRRVSQPVRQEIRGLEDDLNNLTYEEAVKHGIEFVSPAALWDGHEPCGDRSEYVNSIKPYLAVTDFRNVSQIVDGGSFHPTASGQEGLAAVVSCYLNDNVKPPDAFLSIRPKTIDISKTWPPSPTSIGLRPSPGSQQRPLSGCS